MKEKGSSDSTIQSGMTMLTPELTHCILQELPLRLTKSYEAQGFAYATQSYDATLLKVYPGGFGRCSVALNGHVASSPICGHCC